MLTEAELDDMRITSQSALPDEGQITRAAAGGSLNQSTGDFTPATPTTIYDGAMRVRPPTPAEIELIFGDREVTKQRYVATLPWDVDAVLVDDRLRLSSTSDTNLTGRWFRVVTVSTGSYHIDRRLGLEVTE